MERQLRLTARVARTEIPDQVPQLSFALGETQAIVSAGQAPERHQQEERFVRCTPFPLFPDHDLQGALDQVVAGCALPRNLAGHAAPSIPSSRAISNASNSGADSKPRKTNVTEPTFAPTASSSRSRYASP